MRNAFPKCGILISTAMIAVALLLVACDPPRPSTDDKQRKAQEVLLSEANAQVGMPAIHNFRERKMLKDILELRDQNGLTTYTYLYSEMTGKLIFFGETIGYGMPYSAQFSSPEKPDVYLPGSGYGVHIVTVPQAEPNGLFSPSSAEGTWILMKDPNGKDVKPVYVEPRVIVSPFKLNL